MAKPRTQYVCIECGAEFLQYFGRCPDCKAWGSLQEQVIDNTPPDSALERVRRQPKGRTASAQAIAAVPLDQISEYRQSRVSSGYTELDRVLGGGIVPGSLILLGGDPGIGKSTLLLQVAGTLAQQFPILYVCAEESGQQVKLRWQRLAISHPPTAIAQSADIDRDGLPLTLNTTPPLPLDRSTPPHNRRPKSRSTPAPDLPAQLYVLPEISLETILVELESLKPQVAIIDSIQALYFSALNSAPGSVAQVRECTSALMQLAKRDHIALFIVGHVTKEGAIAGPKVLEHLVDTVLYFEGDRFASHRLLRSVKNRFGATQELGVFEMVDRGLEEVANPSALFLGSREELTSGTATIVACEGTRPLVVELQALVSPTSYSSPRRSTTGIEFNRLLQILAVLEKRVGIPLSKLDAYVAASGGLNVAEPAADLGVAIAVAASFRDRIVDPDTVIIGEVGLGGQVRPVSQLEMRLKEAAKLGFKRAIVPKGKVPTGLAMEIMPVSRVLDAIATAFIPSQNRPET
ncbi:DNA repair protein RadA [Trichothermofontia sp.]